MSDDGEEEQEITGPLVFSCAGCRTIVGDSYSFEASDPETKTITLTSASNISRTVELYTSYELHDEGSTYFCFSCKHCGESLGKYYVTTSRDLDSLREKFTFNLDQLTSYELGTAQHGKLPAFSNRGGADSDDMAAKTEEQSETQYELLKITHVMVNLVQRVEALESELQRVTAISQYHGNGNTNYNSNSNSNGNGNGNGQPIHSQSHHAPSSGNSSSNNNNNNKNENPLAHAGSAKSGNGSGSGRSSSSSATSSSSSSSSSGNHRSSSSSRSQERSSSSSRPQEYPTISEFRSDSQPPEDSSSSSSSHRSRSALEKGNKSQERAKSDSAKKRQRHLDND